IWRSPWNLKRQPSPCSSACNTRWRAPSCPHVACASIGVRSSRSTTSINRRSAMCRHLSHLSLMISFLILSTCLILLLLREVRGSLSEMYCPLRVPWPLRAAFILLYLEFCKRNVDRQLLIPTIDFYGNSIAWVLGLQGIAQR